MKKTDLDERTILVGEYGSFAQGTATADSDHDYMAVYVESPEEVFGLEKADSKRVSDAKDGEKSAPGSSDATYHTLRKFVALAAAGNPTVGSILWLPVYEKLDMLGGELVAMREAFASKKAGQAYLGYMDAQIKAFAETGRKNRAELVEQYGYDIKFGYHAFRLGVQGFSMMTTGAPMVPLKDGALAFAQDIRAGEVPKEVLMSTLEDVRENLRESIDRSDLPDYANYEAINAWLVAAHQYSWGYMHS